MSLEFIKFNVDGLMRGDYQSRMQGYAIARQNDWLSANDIREMENLNAISDADGGNFYLVNGNFAKLKDAGAAYRQKAGDTREQILELDSRRDDGHADVAD